MELPIRETPYNGGANNYVKRFHQLLHYTRKSVEAKSL